MRTHPLLPIFLLLAAALVAVPTPAGAEEADPVTIIVEAPEKLLSPHGSFSWTLTLTWAEAEALNTTGPANALDLLAHVVAEHDSTYTATWYDLDGDGTTESAFVDEVNGVASQFTLGLVGYFWALYEDGASASSGMNQIELAPGHEIRLTYTGWPVDA